MEVLIVSLLILIGIGLILLEFLVVPGVTVAGIGGLIFFVGAVWYGYNEISTLAGHLVLTTTSILFLVSLVYTLRFKTWQKVSLHTNIEGKLNPLLDIEVATGDKGIAISRLAPVGKVNINGSIMEAKSIIGLVDEHTPIEVISVNTTQVIVKPLNN